MHVFDGLSRRTLNVFHQSKIEDIDELCKFSESDLLHLKNFGRRSLNEVNEFLYGHKRWLKAKNPSDKSLIPVKYLALVKNMNDVEILELMASLIKEFNRRYAKCQKK